MATKAPRIAFTPSVELRAALDRFSAASGVSSASLVASLLAETVPVIDAMTAAYKQARSAPSQAADTMREAMHGAMSKAAQASLALRPAGLLDRPRRPWSRGFDPLGYPSKPLVSYRSLPTTLQVASSSSGVLRLWGALNKMG